ncbi:MAG: hypothetical protein IH972_04945 [Candidatus Marinimicrobia bacterium]|nr:hypothetical protein [Candidatus Neomarinimicrobiota bacterium]
MATYIDSKQPGSGVNWNSLRRFAMSLRSSTVRSALRVYLGQFIFLLMIALFVGGRSLCAQDISATEAILNSHLNAGEFGPARSLAQQQQDSALRNRWFGIISSAQVASGARRASVDTASYISDDRQRSSLLQEIGSKPIGSGRGGGVQADFDALIDLITSTIAPDSWDEAGGPGTISEFATGVYVDSSGTLRKLSVSPGSSTLASLRRIAARDSGNHQVVKVLSPDSLAVVISGVDFVADIVVNR